MKRKLSFYKIDYLGGKWNYIHFTPGPHPAHIQIVNLVNLEIDLYYVLPFIFIDFRLKVKSRWDYFREH